MINKKFISRVLFMSIVAFAFSGVGLSFAAGTPSCGDGRIDLFGADGEAATTGDNEECDCGTTTSVTIDPENNNICTVDGVGRVANDIDYLCTDTCKRTYCQDGHPQVVNSQGLIEICDDGNNVDNDTCNNDCCFYGTCGNGVVDDGEACDLGRQNGQPGSTCSATCTLGTDPDTPDPDPPVVGGNNLLYILAALLITVGGLSSFFFYKKGRAK